MSVKFGRRYFLLSLRSPFRRLICGYFILLSVDALGAFLAEH